MTEHKASCQCGALTVLAVSDPEFVIVCNCKACQKRTGSPFGEAGYFKQDTLTISGPVTQWSRKAESGRDVTTHFCPTCGTTLYWTLEMRPGMMGVAAGGFDTDLPTPIRAIWTDKKHGWVTFPENWETYPHGSPGS